MRVSVRTSDRVVAQWGEAPGELAGCVVEALTDAERDRLVAALAQPNGGVTLSPDHATVTALPVPPPDPAEVARQQVDQTERDALAAIRTRQQTYLDTPLASITGAMTVVAVKDLIRVIRWLAWNQTGRLGNP